MRKKNEKNFWDMEIIGNRRKMIFFKFYDDSLLQVPFCKDESVQLFRVAFFRRDFFQNPFFSKYVKNCNIFGQILNIWVKLILRKQDSKELGPRPLANAPKTFNSKKKLFKLLMLKGSLSFNANNAPKTSISVKNA